MKRIIRRLLNNFGYDIIKTEQKKVFKGGERLVTVRDYQITIPGNNTLINTYRVFPQFNKHLSSLAITIAAKYPDMTVVDIGANVGDTIAILKSAVDLPIIGIEGDDISYSYLERNTKQFSGVDIVKTFLGEKKQDILVNLEKSGWNTTIIPTTGGNKSISLATLDEIVENEKFRAAKIKLLKIDAEGFDTIILRGAYGTVDKNRPVLYFEYNYENMHAIHEDGLATLFSFVPHGYNKIAFFDYVGELFLVTTLSNVTEIGSLHDYLTLKTNLFGYYDICVFHQDDDDLATKFFLANKPTR